MWRVVLLPLMLRTSARLIQADSDSVYEEWPDVLKELTQPADGFVVPSRGVSSVFSGARAQRSSRSGQPVAVVNEIGSAEEFEKALDAAGDSLVIVDYATSWCGPCKIIAPKFAEMSDQYTDVTFLKVMGDSSKEADMLMRSQGVKALPSFHFWKGKVLVEKVSGAKPDALRQAIEANK